MSGPQRRRSVTVLIVVGVALALGLTAAAIRPDWHAHPLDFTMPTSKPRPSPYQISPHTATPPPRHTHPGNTGRLAVVGWVLAGLAFAAVVAVFWRVIATVLAVAWRVIRGLLGLAPVRQTGGRAESGITGDVAEQPDLPTMQRGLAAAQDRIGRDLAPTDAIVASWLELEQAAAMSGISRSAAQTPTEFTADVLARTAADDRATRELLRLYLQARFSTMAITDDEVVQARRHLDDIAAGWDADAEATTAAADSEAES
jgi:hypothetical protein